MRSDTAFFSAAVIFRRLLSGFASDSLSAVAPAFAGEDALRALERVVRR